MLRVARADGLAKRDDPHTLFTADLVRKVYTSDHVLDLVVAPDRSVKRKDEDELALAVEQGVFDAARAAAIEADAAVVEAAGSASTRTPHGRSRG